jgi:competence protein ComFC
MKFVLPTSMCKLCFKEISPTSWHHLFHKNMHICSGCFREFSPVFIKSKLGNTEVLSIYVYDETIRDKLYRLKGCHDIELAPIFLDYFLIEITVRYLGYIMVPAPSWHEDDENREFNHVIEIFKTIPLKMVRALVKTDNVKQADLHFNERQEIGKRIDLIENINFTGKNILFVDDVMTTGATSRACVELLKKAGASIVKILVMSKTIDPKDKTKSK